MDELIAPWELHPALVHFPIAFLLSASAVDVLAIWRPGVARVATHLAIAGVATGALAALGGVLAWLTIPGHTEGAHDSMTAHWIVQVLALVLFAARAGIGWRSPERGAPLGARAIGWLGAIAVIIGSGIGGQLVFRHGMGVAVEAPPGAAEHGSGHHH